MMARLMRNADESHIFAEGLDELAPTIPHLSEEDLAKILHCFDDATDDPGAMFRLVHAIERAEMSRYSSALLRELPRLNSARDWAKTLLTRIVNSDQHVAYLEKSATNLSPPTKLALLGILSDIAHEGGPPAARADRLMSTL